LWRPPLAVFTLLPIEAFVEDPAAIYAIFATLTLTMTAVLFFYLMKSIGGVTAAHLSQLLLFSTPAFISLVSRQLTFLSHMLMFATLFLALHATIGAWSNRSFGRNLWVGGAWGLAYLARPEMSALFGATVLCSALLYRGRPLVKDPAWRLVGAQISCFLLIYLPTQAIVHQAATRHHLIGQVPLVTYYAGEYFAARVPAADRDGEGYAASVSRFGDPATYQYSLVRFAVLHPDAVLTRVRQNIANTVELFSTVTVIRWRDWLAFLVLASALVFSKPPPFPARYLILYCTLLTAASSYFLLFHVDPRYPLAFVLMAAFSMLVGAMLAWQYLAGTWQHRTAGFTAIAVSTAAMSVLCLSRVDEAVRTAGEVALDLAPYRAVAEHFRAEIGAAGTPAVSFAPLHSDPMLFISYFADTAIPWKVDANTFPRDRIYSFTHRDERYALLPASATLAAESEHPVLWRHRFPRIGEYICVDQGAAK
jgi:hypothetical protein